MKIVLTTGMIPKAAGRSYTRVGMCPPIGLGYMAAVLEKNGHDVEIFDCLQLNYSVDEVVSRILAKKPDLVGISVMTIVYEGAKMMAQAIKQSSGVPVVFGGPHCTSFPCETLAESPDVDFVMTGECEYAFLSLIEAVQNSLLLSDVPQLYFRDDSGGIRFNKSDVSPVDLDALPYPGWHLYNDKLYFPTIFHSLTSRGCSYSRCAFCMRTGPLYQRYRRRSVKNVVRELELLKNEKKITEVVFVDDNFVQDPEWIGEFCSSMIKKKWNIRWQCNARVNTVTESMVKQMAEAGCYVIGLGIESGNQETLDYLQKGITLEQVEKAVGVCKKFGIKVWGFFMLCLPKETREMTLRTIEFAKRLDLDLVQFVPVRPLRGTLLYSMCEKEGQIFENDGLFYDTASFSPFYFVPKVSFVPNTYEDKADVVKMLKLAYYRFYLRPGYAWKILTARITFLDLKKIFLLLWLFMRIVLFRQK